MRVAFLSDIHANYRALRAVSEHLRQYDKVFFCGDAVGYGSEPNEVCAFLMQHDIPSVKGNHDAMLLGELPVPEGRQELYRTAWTQKTILRENLKWLEQRPIECVVELDSYIVKIRHASPWDLTTYLYPDSPRLDEAMPRDGSLLVLGHTHHPFVKPGVNGILVNCGSVGFPRGGAPGAQFTQFDTSTGTWVQRTVMFDGTGRHRRPRDAGVRLRGGDSQPPS